MLKIRYLYKISVVRTQEKSVLGRTKYRWEYNIKMAHRGTECEE
jgi:hypothetical protein